MKASDFKVIHHLRTEEFENLVRKAMNDNYVTGDAKYDADMGWYMSMTRHLDGSESMPDAVIKIVKQYKHDAFMALSYEELNDMLNELCAFLDAYHYVPEDEG